MAEPTAHTEAPAGHHEFPPFVTHHFPSQILWLALTFVLLYVLMSRVALPRIGAILAARQRRIAEDLAAAQRFKEQSEVADAARSSEIRRCRSARIAPMRGNATRDIST